MFQLEANHSSVQFLNVFQIAGALLRRGGSAMGVLAVAVGISRVSSPWLADAGRCRQKTFVFARMPGRMLGLVWVSGPENFPSKIL